MGRGEETPEQFALLIRLLHREGFIPKAEDLLRRNMIVVADGRSLYYELFGTEKPDEFENAITAFIEQFSVQLTLAEDRGFLDRVFRSEPRSHRFDEFRLLNEPCLVKFDFAEPDVVMADVMSETSEEYLLLGWVHGVWEPTERGAA